MSEIIKTAAPYPMHQAPIDLDASRDSIAGETLTWGDTCYIGSDGLTYKCLGVSGAASDRSKGQVLWAAAPGERTRFVSGIPWMYSSGLPKGADVYLSASVPGGLATTPPYSGSPPVGYAYTDSQISFYQPGAIASTSSAPITYSITTATDGATVTFDLSTSVFQTVVLGGNRTLAVSGDVVGRPFTIILKQDATGSRTVTWWSGIRWAGGSAPSLTAMAAKEDTLVFIKRGNGDYMGFVSGLNS